jgi:hypothetical protein
MQATRYFMLLFLLFITATGKAQKITAELKQVRDAYLAHDNLSADVSVTIYSGRNDKTGTQAEKGMIRKAGKKYYSKFGTEEMISNEQGTLLVDHSIKEMMFFEKVPRKMRLDANSGFPGIDSLVTLSDSVRSRGIKEGLKLFSFYDRTQAAVQTDIYVDPATNLVRRIVYWYNESMQEEYGAYKIVVEYSGYSFKDPDPAFFSAKKYITLTKGRPAATAAYKHYNLEFVKNEQL